MKKVLMAIMIFSLTGCVVIDGGKETLKTMWGSSTKQLEAARANAIVKTYYYPYWEVVKGARDSMLKKDYVIFKEDEIRGYIVLMGIKGSVNTTEVAVFFVEENDHQTRVEIASLSTNAKRIVAKNIFYDLDILFGLALPDPEPKKNN